MGVMNKLLKLVPLRGEKYTEQVIIYDDDYPSMLFHIDFFWEGRDHENKIYNLLQEGETVFASVDFNFVVVKSGGDYPA